MEFNENLPAYPIGIAAQILNVHPRTLRIYEAEGLVKPRRISGKRMFSQNDIVWIDCLRKLIHDENISIPGIKKLLEYAPCWKLKNCSAQVRSECLALRERKKNCWEFSQNTCEKSCLNCDVYLEGQKQTV